MLRRLSRTIGVIALCVIAASQASAQATAPLPPDSTQRARSYARWFFAAQADSLYPHVVSAGSRTYASKESLTAFLAVHDKDVVHRNVSRRATGV